MIDGRFDHHFLELFAQSSDRLPVNRALLWTAVVSAVLAVVASVGLESLSASHLKSFPYLSDRESASALKDAD